MSSIILAVILFLMSLAFKKVEHILEARSLYFEKNKKEGIATVTKCYKDASKQKYRYSLWVHNVRNELTSDGEFLCKTRTISREYKVNDTVNVCYVPLLRNGKNTAVVYLSGDMGMQIASAGLFRALSALTLTFGVVGAFFSLLFLLI